MKNSQYNFIIANIWLVGLVCVSAGRPWYVYAGMVANALIYYVLSFTFQYQEEKHSEPTIEMLVAVRDHVNAEIKKRDL